MGAPYALVAMLAGPPALRRVPIGFGMRMLGAPHWLVLAVVLVAIVADVWLRR